MYKLSSCDCVDDTTCNYFKEPTVASNCNFNPAFDCLNNVIFKEQSEPLSKTGFTMLNPNCISNYYAKDYQPINCVSDTSCSKGYVSTDPRLISSVHQGQILILDRPPIDQGMKMSDIYTDPRMIEFGKKYINYQDIKAGDIMYYVDREREDALSYPNFTIPAKVTGVLYSNPMNAIWPRYNRQPIFDNNVLETTNRTYSTGLSSLDDSNEFREEIMNMQMRPQDRTRYNTRWS